MYFSGFYRFGFVSGRLGPVSGRLRSSWTRFWPFLDVWQVRFHLPGKGQWKLKLKLSEQPCRFGPPFASHGGPRPSIAHRGHAWRMAGQTDTGPAMAGRRPWPAPCRFGRPFAPCRFWRASLPVWNYTWALNTWSVCPGKTDRSHV